MKRYFPPGRTDLLQFSLGHISRQDLLDKMLKDYDEVTVLSAVSCFLQRNLTRIHDYFKNKLFLDICLFSFSNFIFDFYGFYLKKLKIIQLIFELARGRKFNYVLIYYVQTNVNYLPRKYSQNQVQRSIDGSHADPNTFITLFLKIHFKRTI